MMNKVKKLISLVSKQPARVFLGHLARLHFTPILHWQSGCASHVYQSFVEQWQNIVVEDSDLPVGDESQYENGYG